MQSIFMWQLIILIHYKPSIVEDRSSQGNDIANSMWLKDCHKPPAHVIMLVVTTDPLKRAEENPIRWWAVVAKHSDSFSRIC